MIRPSCPYCGGKMRVKEEYLGITTYICPDCRIKQKTGSGIRKKKRWEVWIKKLS